MSIIYLYKANVKSFLSGGGIFPASDLLYVEQNSDCSGYGFRRRKSDPCIVKPYKRHKEKYRDKAEYLAGEGKQNAWRSVSDSLKKHRQHKRKGCGNKAYSDYSKSYAPDFKNFLRI